MSSQSSLQVVELSGELDIGRREEMLRVLRVDGPGGPILLDFSAVTYADSTIITALVEFRNAATLAARRIALLVGNRQFARLIQYAGLHEAIAVYEDRADALTFLTEPGR